MNFPLFTNVLLILTQIFNFCITYSPIYKMTTNTLRMDRSFHDNFWPKNTSKCTFILYKILYRILQYKFV